MDVNKVQNYIDQFHGYNPSTALSMAKIALLMEILEVLKDNKAPKKKPTPKKEK